MGEVLIKRARTEQDMAGLRALRLKVFVEEQGVPEELELDALDGIAIHAIAMAGHEVVGTGRLVLLEPLGPSAQSMKSRSLRERAG